MIVMLSRLSLLPPLSLAEGNVRRTLPSFPCHVQRERESSPPSYLSLFFSTSHTCMLFSRRSFSPHQPCPYSSFPRTPLDTNLNLPPIFPSIPSPPSPSPHLVHPPSPPPLSPCSRHLSPVPRDAPVSDRRTPRLVPQAHPRWISAHHHRDRRR